MSPFISYIHPPETFYHEFRGSGGYVDPLHQLNNDPSIDAKRFVHFGDIYFRNTTTLMDIGHYQIPFTDAQYRTVLYSFYVLEQGMIPLMTLKALQFCDSYQNPKILAMYLLCLWSSIYKHNRIVE